MNPLWLSASIFLLFLGAPTASCWGPVSHLHFATVALASSSAESSVLGTCLCPVQRSLTFSLSSSLKQSCDMADAFYFPMWSQKPPNCSIPVFAMHSPVTAGYFVKFAQSPKGQEYVLQRFLADPPPPTTHWWCRFKSSTFDPVSFALGFGSHMVADIVGFNPHGGYLGTPESNFVTVFQFMSAVDGYFLALSDVGPSECTCQNLRRLPSRW